MAEQLKVPLRLVGQVVKQLIDAGLLLEGTILDTSEADWDRLQGVNAKGVYLLTKSALPAILERGGGSRETGGETVVRVDHCLLALPGTAIDDLEEVMSHPQAIAQSEEFLSA